VVARDFLVNENPSMIVNIVDASNLERNLYLTVQSMEMGRVLCTVFSGRVYSIGIKLEVDSWI